MTIASNAPILEPCLAVVIGGGLSFVQYLLIFIYLVVSMIMLYNILLPFKPDFSEHLKIRFTMADIIVLVFQLGAAGAIAVRNPSDPNSGINMMWMFVYWIVLGGAWLGSTSLAMRAGITESKRRAVAVGFVIPVAFFGVFGFNAYLFVSLYHLRAPHPAALLVPPLLIAAWFLARWANNRSSENE